MAKRKGQHYWTELDMPSGALKFYTCKDLTDENGKPCEGEHDPVSNRVKIDGGWPEERQKTTACHEATHSAFHNMTPEAREQIFGCKDGSKEMALREELLCRSLETMLYSPMIKSNWLKLPKPPKV